MAKDKVVLAYSGGLDTTVIIPWLKENYDYDVIAVCIDVGQGDDWEAIKGRALKTGASACYVVDARKEYIEEYSDGRTERGKALRSAICEKLHLKSLEFQNIDLIIEAIGLDESEICTYCWNGKE